MSHFTVLACLPADTDPAKLGDALSTALAPYDEGLEAEPYREYLDGEPAAHWAVNSLRKRGWDLPADGLSWTQVAAAHNSEYGDEPLLVEGDGQRAYTMSTSNPNGHWDWWVTGGRWQRTLLARPGVARDRLVFGRPGTFGDSGGPVSEPSGALWCDGGRIRDLDFSQMRLLTANADLDLFEKWEKVVTEHGAPIGWAQIRAQVEAGELTISAARNLYNDQAAIKAAREQQIVGYSGCPVEEYAAGRDVVIERAALSAVPGYALIDLEGKWVAPGRMGWFGMSTENPDEKADYQRAVNRYLDPDINLDLDPDTFVVLVDCHV